MTEQEWLLIKAQEFFFKPPRGRDEWTLFMSFMQRLESYLSAMRSIELERVAGADEQEKPPEGVG